MRRNIYGWLALIIIAAIMYVMGSKFFHVTDMNLFLLIMVLLTFGIVLLAWMLGGKEEQPR